MYDACVCVCVSTVLSTMDGPLWATIIIDILYSYNKKNLCPINGHTHKRSVDRVMKLQIEHKSEEEEEGNYVDVARISRWDEEDIHTL